MKHYKVYTFSLLFIAILSGCGGGSSDSASDTSSTPKKVTGVFVDSAVEGLNYTCSSSSKIETTNKKGEFTCNEGDKVSFFIGKVSLGEFEFAKIITPQTIFPNNPQASLNVAQLLQTLDNDNDPSNGISLDTDSAGTLADIDFTSYTFDVDVQTKLDKLQDSLVLVTEDKAQEHLEETMVSMNIDDSIVTGTDCNFKDISDGTLYGVKYCVKLTDR